MTPTDQPPNFSRFNKRDLTALFQLVGPVVFIVLAALYFHEFVWHAIAANLGINLGIISAASLGVVLIVIRMISAQEDFRIIERFGYEASQGVYMKTLLEEPWLKRRYVRHYLSHIANTGGTLSTQLEQSAIESELHALETDYNSRIEFPQFLVGFMIAMGLLGTFIGLLETLTGISGMLDGMGGSGNNVQEQFMKLVVELRKPLAGMGIAFSASMFGLITSLMLAIMMTNLRRFISRVISLARNVMHDLTEMAREKNNANSVSGSLSPLDVDALLRGTRSLSDSMGGGMGELTSAESGDGIGTAVAVAGGPGAGPSAAVTGQFDVLAMKIEALLEAFRVSNDTGRKLLEVMGFGPRMRELSEKTLEEMKLISASTSEQQRLMETLITVNTNATRSISSMLEIQKQAHSEQQGIVQALIDVNSGVVQSLTSLLEHQKLSNSEQQKSLHSLVDISLGTARTVVDAFEMEKQSRVERQRDSQSFVNASAHTARTVLSLLETQRQANAEQQREMRALIEANGEATRAVTNLFDTQKQARTEFAGLMRKLSEQLTDAKDVGLGSARHLHDIKESFTKLCNSVPMIDLIAAGVGGHNALLESLIEETRRSHEALSEINKSVLDVGNS